MKLQASLKPICVTALLAVAGCAGISSDKQSNVGLLDAPLYARVIPTGWAVDCDFHTVYIESNRENRFYKRDNTQKSFEEMCAEDRTSTRIIR